MAKKLIIIESPGKIKTIKKCLGSNYDIEASYGHVRDLPKTTLGIEVDNNFKPRYKVLKDKKEVVEKLKAAAKKADMIYLATDPDREGEAISWHLSEILKVDEKKICRITFNEITKTAVTSAIKNPRQINLNLVDAQQARRVLDRLVGYQISPILWHKVKSHLSAGRVQSVAVRLVCDREDEIEAFVPEEYWSLEANVKDSTGKKKFAIEYYGNASGKIKLENADAVEKVKESCTGDFKVAAIKRSSREKHPLPPFITSTLQQDAFKNLGFSTSRTMKNAQEIYEGVEIKGHGTIGLITYMRTDSTRVSAEALDAVRSTIKERYGDEYLPASPNVYSKKKNSQDAHEAIRPTYIELTPESIAGSLTADNLKLYKLIYNRFIASQMKSAVYDTVGIDVENNGNIFKASSSVLVFDGYKKVYEDETESKDKTLPEMNVSDILKFIDWKQQQHFTQPSSRYTEGSLVKKLEELGIGRPSTFAPTVALVLKRNYIKKDKKALYPTEMGRLVNRILIDYFDNIISYGFTADMENQLDEIEEGKLDWVEVIRKFYPPFEKMLEEADKSIEKVTLEPRVTDIPCEKCGRMMVIKDGRFGEFLACPGYPECNFTKAIVEESEYPCPKCGRKLVYKRSKKGMRFLGCPGYPECDFASTYPPTGEKCPECGDYLVLRSTKNGDMEICKNFKCKFKRPYEKK